MMNKKIISLIIAVSLILTVSLSTVAFADDISEKQGELENVEEQKEDTEKNMTQIIGDIEKQQKEVDRLQEELSAKQKEIGSTLDEIDVIMADIEERREGLNSRLRVMYKNGSIGYLDVILGSRSLSELISNVEMIQRIYKYDQKVMIELKEQQDALEEQRAVLKEEKAEIDAKKAEAEEENKELKEKKNVLQGQLDQLNADADRISSEIVALQSYEPEPEENKQDTEQNKPSNPSGLIWPCDSRIITSPFGFRFHPVTGQWTGHTGLDIG